MGKEFYDWGNPKNTTIVSLHGMGNTKELESPKSTTVF